MFSEMEKLLRLLLEHPELAHELSVPCCLWAAIEREDDAALSPSSLHSLSISSYKNQVSKTNLYSFATS